MPCCESADWLTCRHLCRRHDWLPVDVMQRVLAREGVLCGSVPAQLLRYCLPHRPVAQPADMQGSVCVQGCALHHLVWLFLRDQMCCRLCHGEKLIQAKKIGLTWSSVMLFHLQGLQLCFLLLVERETFCNVALHCITLSSCWPAMRGSCMLSIIVLPV